MKIDAPTVRFNAPALFQMQFTDAAGAVHVVSWPARVGKTSAGVRAYAAEPLVHELGSPEYVAALEAVAGLLAEAEAELAQAAGGQSEHR